MGLDFLAQASVVPLEGGMTPMDAMHRDEANRLMAEISALLEDAHELATAGQSSKLPAKEVTALAAELKDNMRSIEGQADKVLAMPDSGQ